MARRPRTKGRQHHPTGPLSTVDEDWKAKVRAAMEAYDPPLDQKQLAAKVGVSRAAITKLFKPGPQQIRYKDKVHALFKWPVASKVDEVRRRIDNKWFDLSDDERDLVADLVEKLAGKP